MKMNSLFRNLYVAALIGIIRYKKLDWKAVHQYGTHLSDTRPPMHVSSESMIVYLIESIDRILRSIQKDPLLVTISRYVPSFLSRLMCVSFDTTFRCVTDGYCTKEQADLIQTHVEKKICQVYKVGEMLGNRLSTDDGRMSDNDDGNDRLSTFHADDNDNKSSLFDGSNMIKSGSSKTDADSHQHPSMNRKVQRSPSPSRPNLSPGEVKGISPSSLSDASPISS
jgi:hypothetical protein